MVKTNLKIGNEVELNRFLYYCSLAGVPTPNLVYKEQEEEIHQPEQDKEEKKEDLSKEKAEKSSDKVKRRLKLKTLTELTPEEIVFLKDELKKGEKKRWQLEAFLGLAPGNSSNLYAKMKKDGELADKEDNELDGE